MPVVKLSQRFIDHELKCAPGKLREEFCDLDQPGLYVLASTAGKIASFFLRYKNANGKTCHQKIGRTTDIDLAEARKRAKALKAEITLGADPRGAEKAKKQILTFEQFMNQEYFPIITPMKRSIKRDHELARRLIAEFGNVPLNKINRRDVQKFHTNLREVEGLAPATCDLHIRCLKHALNLALDWNLMEGKNPVSRMPLYNVDNRLENLLSDDDLQRLLGVLRTDANRPVCLVMLFLLSTGSRLQEVLKSTWDQVDIENRVFKIPATNSKSKRPRSVPLNDSALDVLKQLGTESKSGAVFLSRVGLPFTTITKVWHRIRQKAGVPKMRIHDARHTTAQLMCAAGRSLLEIKEVLGHAHYSTTTRYTKFSMKALQQAANSVSAKLMIPSVVVHDELEKSIERADGKVITQAVEV